MALSFSSMPPASSFFAAYASVSAFIMLLQTIINQLIPLQLKHYVLQHLRLFFTPRRNHATIIVEERDGMSSNEIYYATETYLCAKIRPNIERLKICKHHKDSGVLVRFAQCEKILDFFEEIELEWRFVNEEKKKTSKVIDESTDSVIVESEKRYFELRFDGKYKDKILDFYVPFVLQSAKMINSEKKVVKLHTLACASSYGSSIMWDSINLLHPSTFETLAIEPSLKKGIIEDLDRFVRRKEFYRKVGRAWKRGYLLYGPPGTGKSSLIAAIANYLKFDIYDLELTNIKRDSDLRRLLLRTANRSILVIEDIDCTVELPDRKGLPSTGSPNGYWQSQRPRDQFTLSGLLNFIDGLWSSCGDERIIIFTTNNKDKLDPALLRPGRMDMHIHMSYLTPDGFKLLASTYLNVHHEHPRLSEIEDLIKTIKITPAEVAEELMKSDDVDTILDGLVDFLKNKNNNNNDNNQEDAMDDKKTDDANEEEEDEKVNQCKAADESMINLCAKCAKQI